jgi:Tol biopolymer transport system component
MLRVILCVFTSMLVCGCTRERAEARPNQSAQLQTGDTAGVVTKRLLANLTLPANMYAPLPDGKRFAVATEETGDLAIKDISTGAITLLTHNSRPWGGQLMDAPRVSRDGKYVAYTWQPVDTIWSIEVRVSNVEDGSSRTLITGTQQYTVPMDWSNDGRSIVGWRQREDGTTQIVLISTVAQNAVRVLKTLGWRNPLGMSFSPDGRYIVYDTPSRQDSDARDIYILASDGSSESRVVGGAANEYVLGWAPDGRNILFASDRSGVPGAWLLPVNGGKPRGEPQLVKSGLWRMLPVAFTSDGSYYYGVETGGRDLFVVPFDPATQKAVGVAAPITRSELALSSRSDWSHDGRMIAYNIDRGQTGSSIIAIHSVESGDVRQIPLPPRVGYISGVRWAPDGKSLLLRANDRGHNGVLQLDLERASLKEILRTWTISLDVVPGTNKFVYLDSEQTAIFVRDLDDGTERLLYRVEKGSIFPQITAVSPDGKTLAFFRRTEDYRGKHELMTMPLQGGEPRRVTFVEGTPSSTALRWTKDGRSLLFSSMKGEKEQTMAAWSVPVTGGTPTHTGVRGVHLRHLAFSPDGRRLSYMAGVGSSELWVMQRFLPR